MRFSERVGLSENCLDSVKASYLCLRETIIAE
jgi:hypothetical protein